MLTAYMPKEMLDLNISHLAYGNMFRLKRTSKHLRAFIQKPHVLLALTRFGRIESHPRIIRMVDLNDQPAQISLVHPNSSAFTFRYEGIEYIGVVSHQPTQFYVPDFDVNTQETLRSNMRKFKSCYRMTAHPDEQGSNAMVTLKDLLLEANTMHNNSMRMWFKLLACQQPDTLHLRLCMRFPDGNGFPSRVIDFHVHRRLP